MEILFHSTETPGTNKYRWRRAACHSTYPLLFFSLRSLSPSKEARFVCLRTLKRNECMFFQEKFLFRLHLQQSKRKVEHKYILRVEKCDEDLLTMSFSFEKIFFSILHWKKGHRKNEEKRKKTCLFSMLDKTKKSHWKCISTVSLSTSPTQTNGRSTVLPIALQNVARWNLFVDNCDETSREKKRPTSSTGDPDKQSKYWLEKCTDATVGMRFFFFGIPMKFLLRLLDFTGESNSLFGTAFHQKVSVEQTIFESICGASRWN